MQIERIHPETGRLQVFTEYESDSSLTQQQWKNDCDINRIMKKYSETGENPHKNLKLGAYADMSDITDYQGMLDTVRFAQQAFDTLEASVRSRFQNDPAQLINFLQNPNNIPEGIQLGLYAPNKTEPINTTITNSTSQTPPPTKQGTE